MFRKVVVTMVGVVMSLSLVLAGCGDKAGSAAGSTAQNSKAATTAQATPEPVKEVKFNTFGIKAGNELGALPDLNKKFESENPGVTVNYETMSSESYRDTIKAKMASGAEIDVFHCNQSDVPIFSKAGYILDLTNEPWVSNYVDTIKSLVTVPEDGKVYVLAVDASGFGMFANTDLLQKNGLSYPKTWPEFIAACDKLKAAGVTPVIMGNKTGWTGDVFTWMGINYLIKGKEASFWPDVQAGKMKFSDVEVPAFKKFNTMIEKGYADGKASIGMEWNEKCFQDFVAGKAAFMFGGSWQVAEAERTNKDFKFMFGPTPVNDDGAACASVGVGVTYAINAASKNLDLAKKYLAFMAAEDNLAAWVKSQAAYTTMKGGKSTDDPNVSEFAAAVSANNTMMFGWPGFDGIDTWSPTSKSIQMMILGKKTPEQAAADVDAEMEKQMKLKK